MKTWLVIVLAFAACKKDEASPATGSAAAGSATTGDCATIISAAIDQEARAGVKSGAGGSATIVSQAEIDKMANDVIVSLGPVKAATIKACVDDKWSADVLDCMKKNSAVTTCDDKLTADQRKHRDDLASEAAKKATAGAPAVCNKYADFEIKCASAGEDARPTILDFCTRARAGNPDPTYKLIALESRCAETATDCDSYKTCVDKKKQEESP